MNAMEFSRPRMRPPLEDNPNHSGSGPVGLRLLIADDQPRVRQSLVALLTALRWNSPGRHEIPIEIVGAADTGEQAVAKVASLNPDVVVMDLPTHDSALRLVAAEAKLDGLGTIRMIKSRWPAVRVVVHTMYATDRAAVLLAGADVFLLKGCPTSELLAAVMPAGA